MKLFDSFSSRLYFSILLVTVLIFGVAAWVEYGYSSRHEYTQATRYTSLMLEDMIKSVNMKFLQVERNVNFHSPEVYNRLASSKDMLEVARKLVVSDSVAMGAAVVFMPDTTSQGVKLHMDYVHQDSIGSLITSSYDENSGYYYPNMDWFVNALKTHGGSWSDPYFDAGGGNALMTTYSRALRYPDGRPFAVITSDVELNDIVRQLETLRPFPESYVFIIDEEGNYISHPNSGLMGNSSIFDRRYERDDYGMLEVGSRMVSGQSGATRVHLGGRDLLICYAPLAIHGWSVGCVTPYDAVVKRLGLASWTMMIIMLCGLAVMALCIRLLLRYMTDPLRQLVKAANRISAGDFNYPITEEDGKGEISELRRAFIEMQHNLRDYVRELTDATKSREREQSLVDVARVIQERLLPKAFPIYPLRPEIDIYGRLDSGTGIVADVYDYHVFDTKLYFMMGSAENRGMLSSLVLVVTRSMFRAAIIRGESPAKILTDINQLAYESKADYRESIFIGTIDYATGEMTYCNAGHPNPIIWRNDNNEGWKAGPLECDSQPLCGERGGVKYVDEHTTLHRGDTLVICSQGFVEGSDYLGEHYGVARVADSVDSYMSEHPVASNRKLINHIFKDMIEHTGKKSETDRAVITLTYRERPDAEGIVYANLTLRSTLTDIPRLSTFVDGIATRCGWSEQFAMKISLAFEEAVSSIITYAYGDDKVGDIHITTLTTPQSFSLRLVDDGDPFDPTAEIKKMESAMAEADNNSRGMPANSRAFGFFMINQIMDEMEYCRLGDQNQLVMRVYF